MRSVCIVLLLLLAACKREQMSTPDDGWKTDESNFFSVRYPSRFSASAFNMGNKSKIIPGLTLEPISMDKKTKEGSLVIFHNTKYAGMLLRDGVEAELKFYTEGAGHLLVSPHQVLSRNGNCIAYVLADPAQHCPAELKVDECVSADYAGQCQTPFGKRFSVMGILAVQRTNARLDPAAVEMAKTFDKILATLEFKKF